MVLPRLTLYSRSGCHLCELMLEDLWPLVEGRAELTVADVDEDPGWRAAYGLRVPVLCHDDREVCATVLDRGAVRALLGRGGDMPE